MKIFLIIPTLKQGGAERVMSELANEYANRDIEVHLLLLAKAEAFYKLNKGIKVHYLGFENNGFLKKLVSQFQTFIKLRNLLKLHQPDFVLSFMTKYSVLTIIAGLGLEIKIFVSDRSNPKKQIGKVLSFLRKRTYKKATGIIAQTQLAKEVLFKNTGNVNIKVIPNPVRVIEAHPNLIEENYIINIGRLVSEKGQEYLLEAFAKIKDNSWKLVILGEGPLRSNLMVQATTLGISSRLIMPGSVNNIDEWFSRSKMFVFPSISEGFPNALVEAMAAGLPCVSFNCDAGPRDIIINNNNGILVEEKNIDKLYYSIQKLIDDKSFANTLGKNARKIADELNIKSISTEYFNFCIKQ